MVLEEEAFDKKESISSLHFPQVRDPLNIRSTESGDRHFERHGARLSSNGLKFLFVLK